RSVTLRTASTMNGPIVILGTKRPSMTSRWKRSAPAASASRICSPRRVKSAARIEGAIRTNAEPHNKARHVFYCKRLSAETRCGFYIYLNESYFLAYYIEHICEWEVSEVAIKKRGEIPLAPLL